MEEKKAKKISVSVILLILAIIALVVMGLFIYKLELQAEVDDLNNTVSDLQRKIDKISETLSTNNSNSIQEAMNRKGTSNRYDDAFGFSRDNKFFYVAEGSIKPFDPGRPGKASKICKTLKIQGCFNTALYYYEED